MEKNDEGKAQERALTENQNSTKIDEHAVHN